MSGKRKWIGGAVMAVAAVLGCAYGQLDIVRKWLQFDLRLIGQSIYEARDNKGRWPARVADLAGTTYVRLPYRQAALDKGHFIIVWNQDLHAKPEANRERVLAYDNRSVFSWFGQVWVCRGDLRTECLNADELQTLVADDKR